MYPFEANKMQQSQSDATYRPAFHADNTGSNPVGDAKEYQAVSSNELTTFLLAAGSPAGFSICTHMSHPSTCVHGVHDNIQSMP